VVLRLVFRPETMSLWGFNKTYAEEKSANEVDDDVDLAKTMWMVLRKSKA